MGAEAVRLKPDDRIFRETLAESYARNYDVENAISQYEELIRQDSGNASAWQNAAHLLIIKRPLRSLEFFEEIIDRFGPDWEAYAQMEKIYSVTGNNAGSIKALKGMVGIDPTNVQVKKALGDAYLAADSLDAALKAYNELAELHPGNIALRAAMAHAYLLERDYEHAGAQFDTIMAIDTLSADDQIRFGQIFISFVQRDSAVAPIAMELFRHVRDRHPGDWRPYWFLGALGGSMGNDSSAALNFAKVIEIDSSNADGWMSLASVSYDKGELQRTVDILQSAQVYIPKEFRLHLLLGITYQRMRKLREAAESLERAIVIEEKNVDALGALAMVYDELDRQAESDSTYEKALALDPKNHLILNNYGYSLADRNLQIDRALVMAQEAISQQPENTSYLDTIGWIYFRLGRYTEAEEYIKKAIALGSNSAVIHEHLGDIYSKMNDREKALEYWNKALQLDPSNAPLAEKINRGSL
jgi:tetratricopeptide (TPR) repeat protein